MEVLATQAPVRVAVTTAQAVLVVAPGLGIVLALFVQPAQVVGAGILVAVAPGGLEVLQSLVVVGFLLEQQLGQLQVGRAVAALGGQLQVVARQRPVLGAAAALAVAVAQIAGGQRRAGVTGALEIGEGAGMVLVGMVQQAAEVVEGISVAQIHGAQQQRPGLLVVLRLEGGQAAAVCIQGQPEIAGAALQAGLLHLAEAELGVAVDDLQGALGGQRLAAAVFLQAPGQVVVEHQCALLALHEAAFGGCLVEWFAQPLAVAVEDAPAAFQTGAEILVIETFQALEARLRAPAGLRAAAIQAPALALLDPAVVAAVRAPAAELQFDSGIGAGQQPALLLMAIEAVQAVVAHLPGLQVVQVVERLVLAGQQRLALIVESTPAPLLAVAATNQIDLTAIQVEAPQVVGADCAEVVETGGEQVLRTLRRSGGVVALVRLDLLVLRGQQPVALRIDRPPQLALLHAPAAAAVVQRLARSELARHRQPALQVDQAELAALGDQRVLTGEVVGFLELAGDHFAALAVDIAEAPVQLHAGALTALVEFVEGLVAGLDQCLAIRRAQAVQPVLAEDLWRIFILHRQHRAERFPAVIVGSLVEQSTEAAGPGRIDAGAVVQQQRIVVVDGLADAGVAVRDLLQQGVGLGAAVVVAHVEQVPGVQVEPGVAGTAVEQLEDPVARRAEGLDIVQQAAGMALDEGIEGAQRLDAGGCLGVQAFFAMRVVVAVVPDAAALGEQRVQHQGQLVAPLHQRQAVILAAADFGLVVQVQAMGHGALPCETTEARSLAGKPLCGCALGQRLSMARMLARASLPRAVLTSTGVSSWPSQTRSSCGSSSRKRLGEQSMISPYCLRLAAKVSARLRLARVMPT